jgi:hypothetical protein
MDRNRIAKLLNDGRVPQWNNYRKEYPEWIPDLRGLVLKGRNFFRGLKDSYFHAGQYFNLKGALYDETTDFGPINPDEYGLVFEKGQDLNTNNPTNKELEQSGLDIFISHSSSDSVFVKELIELLRSALNIPSQRIRCTSVDGYRLSVGVNTDEQLRKEVYDAKILIGVITPSSMNSAYVLFELGARWGVNKDILPLLACGAEPSILGGPLKMINSVNCDNAAQVHQLVEGLSEKLKISKGPTATYQNKIEQLVKISQELKVKSKAIKDEEPLIFKDGVYWKKIGDELDGPFCQLCFDRDQQIIHLGYEKVYDGESYVDHRFCRACKSNY